MDEWNGWSGALLIQACQGNFEDWAMALLQRGADPDIRPFEMDPVRRPRSEWTALLWAVDNNNAILVRALLAAGATAALRPRTGRYSALEHAVNKGSCGIVRALVEGGANVNVPFSCGRPALCTAAWERRPELVEVLVRCGADPTLTAAGRTGWTALHAAAAAGCLRSCLWLLRAGAAVDARDEDGETPLHAAAAFGTSAASGVVQLLLVWGASPATTGANGKTPAGVAVYDDLSGLLESMSPRQVCARHPIGDWRPLVWTPAIHPGFGSAALRAAVRCLFGVAARLKNSPTLPHMPVELWLQVTAILCCRSKPV